MSEGVEESGSLSDHEAQYHRTAEAVDTVAAAAEADTEPEPVEATEEEPETPAAKAERARDEGGKFTKHKAKSQQASPEDVPRIRELTKRLREAEERAAEYERRASARAPETRREAEPAARSVSAEFGEKEPTIEQFEKEADPYAAWIRAVNRWDRKKEAWEADQQRVATERQKVEQDGQAYLVQKSNEYKAKVEEFSATHPDFNDLIAEFDDWNLPPLVGAAILEHENGPQLVYNLVKRPDELAGLILLTDGKPVNEKTVALATRWLENRALDGQTGSSAPVVQRKPTPTPPNPVRTVPSGSADSKDIESMSLSAFEKEFSRRRR